MITQNDIREAASRIGGRIRRTPIWRLDPSDHGLHGVKVTLKLEFMQVTGSFKPRGAFNALLTAEEWPDAGVIAASGGNHGLAVAHAARSLGLPAEIFVPDTTPETKRRRIAATGATLTIGGASYDEARAASEARAAETGALMIHAYDQDPVLAGQGTVAMEFEQQEPDLTHVLVAVGGGGLYGGVASWFGDMAEVIPVEPDQCPALMMALMMGRPVPAPVGGIAADSLGARVIGERAFAIAQRLGGQVVMIGDEAIRAAQRTLWETLRLAVEPGGATAFAALLAGAWRPPPGSHVGVILCGANGDPGMVAG